MEFTQLSTEIEKTAQYININLDKIVHRPIIKKIMYKLMPKNEFKDLEIALTYLYQKRNDLIKHNQVLEKLNNDLKIENNKIQEQINKIESNENIDIELLVNLRTKYVENSELLTNQIPILIELIGTTLTKLEKALPFIERTIKNRLTINTSLKSLNLLIDNIIELENYSKNLEKQNAKIIDELVLDSTQKIINSVDIEYHKQMKKRNEELKRKYSNAKKIYFEKLEQLNEELKGINK
jgi:hypothetical protein